MQECQDKTEKTSAIARLGPYRYTGKLTPKFAREVCAAVRQGAPIRTALKGHGISLPTILSWEKWAETGEKGPKYTDFFSELNQSWNEWCMHVASLGPKHIERDARVWSTTAAALMPEEYGRRDTIDIRGTIDVGPILAQIASAQRQIAEGTYVEGDWNLLEEGKDAVQGCQQEEGSAAPEHGEGKV